MKDESLLLFIKESNAIEGILRDPLWREIDAHKTLLSIEYLMIQDVCRFVDVVAPGHVLRDRKGLDVRVGDYVAPEGGPNVSLDLESLLHCIFLNKDTPYRVHRSYELLHPFTDGNGRSGRALWLWHMIHRDETPELGFLHLWYYQSLADPSTIKETTP